MTKKADSDVGLFVGAANAFWRSGFGHDGSAKKASWLKPLL
jgi:hypothetical protein